MSNTMTTAGKFTKTTDPCSYPPKGMVKCMREDTAIAFAAERGLCYGVSVADGFYYVGTAAQLEGAAVAVVEDVSGAAKRAWGR